MQVLQILLVLALIETKLPFHFLRGGSRKKFLLSHTVDLPHVAHLLLACSSLCLVVLSPLGSTKDLAFTPDLVPVVVTVQYDRRQHILSQKLSRLPSGN